MFFFLSNSPTGSLLLLCIHVYIKNVIYWCIVIICSHQLYIWVVHYSINVCCKSAGKIQIYRALKKGHLITGTKKQKFKLVAFPVSVDFPNVGSLRTLQSRFELSENTHFFMSLSTVARSTHRPTSVYFSLLLIKGTRFLWSTILHWPRLLHCQGSLLARSN